MTVAIGLGLMEFPFAGASDYLHFFCLKYSLVGRTQNTGLFRGLGLREGDHLSENNEQKDKRPSCCSRLDHQS